MKVFVNGKVVDERRASLPVFDRGFLYGDGLFETMRSYNGKVFKLDEHLKRLYDAAKIIKLKTPLSKTGLKNAIYRLLRINRLRDAYIRLAVSRGEGRVGLDATTARTANIVIITKPFTPYSAELYKKGLSVFISSVRRNENSPLSRIKSINYLNNITARMEAQEKGYNDAILLNNKGNVACGAVSNIFMVRKNTLLTPSVTSGILSGVTRIEVIRIARKLSFKIQEKEISRNEIFKMSEAFFTNTLMEIMPVTKVNGKRIGNGKVGNITKELGEYYAASIYRSL